MRSDSPLNVINLIRSVEAKRNHIRPGTMVLGWAESRQPLAINLERETNIAIVGRDTSRNASLLQAMLYSLINRVSRGRTGLLIANYEIEGMYGRGDLSPFRYAPHCLQPAVANTAEEAITLIYYLANLITERHRQEVKAPSIVAVISNADHLYCKSQVALLDWLNMLLTNGPAVGIHSIITVASPDSPTMCRLLEAAEFSLRIMHQEVGGNYMDFDFTATRPEKSMLFRSAFITDYELYMGIERMNRKAKPHKLPVKSLPVTVGR